MNKTFKHLAVTTAVADFQFLLLSNCFKVSILEANKDVSRVRFTIPHPFLCWDREVKMNKEDIKKLGEFLLEIASV